MNKMLIIFVPVLLIMISFGCSTTTHQPNIQDVSGLHKVAENQIWLSHEHILVDFIGAEHIQPHTWNHDSIKKIVMPFLDQLKAFNVTYFVDATPRYLGRDVLLLEKISVLSGLKIITNTGLYGARANKFIPGYAFEMNAEELAESWINEYKNGIEGTTIKPGFIKIGVDNTEPLDPMHEKLVRTAALTHLQSGLTIASHTGKAMSLWPQLEILQSMGVSPEAFIWVHAQEENDYSHFLRAAALGCWISFDGIGWEMEGHMEKILFAKQNAILDKVLISHDAGWYDPQKEEQQFVPFTGIFTQLLPALKEKGFTDEELNLLLSVNPSKAFSIETRMSTAVHKKE
jgi:phosphotriesterase-related protein